MQAQEAEVRSSKSILLRCVEAGQSELCTYDNRSTATEADTLEQDDASQSQESGIMLPMKENQFPVHESEQ